MSGDCDFCGGPFYFMGYGQWEPGQKNTNIIMCRCCVEIMNETGKLPQKRELPSK